MNATLTILAVIGITLAALAFMMAFAILMGKVLKRRRIDQETTFNNISKHVK